MQTLNHNARWQVSLSNGETFFEGKGDYKEILNEKSPWLRLMDYCSTLDSDVDITSLSLYTKGDYIYNLPSLTNDPKFNAFHSAKKPLYFDMFRVLGNDLIKGSNGYEQEGKGDLYTTIIAYYETHQLQIWVSEANPRISWSLVVMNE